MDIKQLIEALSAFEPAEFSHEERKNLYAVAEIVKRKFGIERIEEVGTESQGTFEYDLIKGEKTVGLVEILTKGIHIHMFTPEVDIIVKDAKEAEEKL